MAGISGQKISGQNAPDSFNSISILLGGKTGREYVIEQSLNNTLGIIQGDWKYVDPSKGPAMSLLTNVELGNNTKPQLYNLKNDAGEKINLAEKFPAEVQKLSAKLNRLKKRV
ncbi:MAG: hypothetical protein WKF68_09170 [Daejeonella sp.]